MDPTSFETHPSRYHHWKLAVDGDVARLTMAVDDAHPHKPGLADRLGYSTTQARPSSPIRLHPTSNRFAVMAKLRPASPTG